MILVSACLAGIECRYNGGDNRVEGIAEMVEKGKAITVCPEELGGLPTPREAVDIEEGDGFAVLACKARLLSEGGQEVTAEFVKGAEKVLQMAQEQGIKLAILKERSPSCGSTKIYNRVNCSSGHEIKRKVIDGMGVTAALLSQHGIKVISEDRLTKDLVDSILSPK